MPIIGRETPADIVVPAPQVSARHAEIEHVRDDTYVITDLGSSNGTWVNGKRVHSTFVKIGDQIALGSYVVDLRAWTGLIPRAVAGMPPLPAGGQVPSAGFGRIGMTPPRPPLAPVANPEAPAQPLPPPPAPTKRRPSGEPGLGTDLAVALAMQKSFTGRAFLTWFLYWLFWLPGVVMNFVYLNEAKRVEQVTGESPPGKGCLTFLIVTHFWLPLVGFLLLLFFGGAMLASFWSRFGG